MSQCTKQLLILSPGSFLGLHHTLSSHVVCNCEGNKTMFSQPCRQKGSRSKQHNIHNTSLAGESVMEENNKLNICEVFIDSAETNESSNTCAHIDMFCIECAGKKTPPNSYLSLWFRVSRHQWHTPAILTKPISNSLGKLRPVEVELFSSGQYIVYMCDSTLWPVVTTVMIILHGILNFH